MSARKKFVIGSFIIIATLIILAYVGYTQSKTYYHTISEVSSMHGSILQQRMRVSGNVKDGSIQHVGGHIQFMLEEEGKTMPVVYTGTDPLPDTFKDGAQALVEGHLASNGHFQAEQIQAKCASKYQATPPGVTPSQAPSQTMANPASAASGS
ncbi:MAG TPA: cytochrome c maturation protein CcmE [Candidatus Acidoferrales bacterium]|nr:cytochrome c maturation protein CcmE [Candidatus Acidoferrales bacterium]